MDQTRVEADEIVSATEPPLPRLDHCDESRVEWDPKLALAPAIWLGVTVILILGALICIGYLQGPEACNRIEEVRAALRSHQDSASQRAAKAFGGVTFAITMALSVAALFWVGVAYHGKSPTYRRKTLFWVLMPSAAAAVLYFVLLRPQLGLQPFSSTWGNVLLDLQSSGCPPSATGIPLAMLILACTIPVCLAAGACLLQQPMENGGIDFTATAQLRILTDRLKQLDQMLYVGALALVFGTLQLSAGMSIALSSMPKPLDLKMQAELCKAVSPVENTGPEESRSVKLAHFQVCAQLPSKIAVLELSENMRGLARGITLSFGLAFSALLVV